MTAGRRPRLLHLTTVDMSLALLLGPQLRAFDEAGYDVVGVAAPGDYRDQVEALGIRFEPLRHGTRSMAPHRDLLALVELVRLFRRLRPDIVHTHNPKPGLYGRVAARLAGVPVVVNTVHGLYALPEDRAAKRRLVYALERAAATCSDAELVQNPEDVATLRRIGIPEDKVALLGNGVDLTRFDPSAVDPARAAELRAELAGDAEVVVGVVGRLVWEKGLAEVFEAARALRATHPGVRFVLVGPTDPEKADGLSEADLAAIAADTGIVFAGRRSDMEVVYAALDLFVLASYREGFPRAAMEASAMGLPVVATDVRGCRQVVDDGVTGVLVPVRDGAAIAGAVAALADDPARRAAAGRAARARALAHFDQRGIIATTLATYARLGVPPQGQVRSLHVCHTTDRRGAELSMVTLVEELAASGVDATAVALTRGEHGPQLPLPVLGRRPRGARALLALRRRARRADVVVAHGASTLLAAHLATRGTRTPYVYRMIGDPRFWGDVRLRELRVSRPLRAAARVVTLWRGAADDVVALHGVAPAATAVIVNGRREADFRPPTAAEAGAARAALGLDPDVPVVGFLGALRWEKAPLLAVEAAALLDGAHLVIAGQGELRAEVQRAAARLGHDRVHVIGPVADPQRFLWAIDALVLTSETEGLPGAVIEAGLCGRPVVATDVGGTSDLVDATTGRLVPRGADAATVAAALREVLADAEVRGAALRRRSLAGFTVRGAADQWVDLLSEVVEAASSVGGRPATTTR